MSGAGTPTGTNGSNTLAYVAPVHNTITRGVQHGAVVQAGHVGSLNFGTPP